MRALTDGRGVDHVFEAVGSPALMLAGIDLLARGGTLICGRFRARCGATLSSASFMSQHSRYRLHLRQYPPDD